ncbi:MAG TPA: hypothetical protein VFG48_08490, partial [Xanthomonadales bacterium]|nr:hypothetical protein [Xanthomonadales bacterium]
MKRLLALMQREYWENQGAFRTTPIVIGGIYIVLTLMFIITFNYFDNEFHTLRELIRFIAGTDPELRGKVMYEGMLVSAGFFTTVLAFVVFFYLLGSLYDDRKDRSILFWKSLPASDTLTVASKLLAAMFLAPLIFWVVFVLTQVIVTIIFSIVVLALGENPWTLFIAVSSPVKAFGMILAS